jgi:6-phosphogluconolactonase
MTASMQHTGTGPHRRQTSPHAHSVVFSPDNRFALAPDLGADRVFIFKFDAAKGSLTPNDPPFWQAPAGSGPRQISFHPSGKFAYLINELVAKITVFGWSAQDGKLTEMDTILAMSPDAKGEPSGGAVAMDPRGRYYYTTTRNDNSIETYAIDQDKGALSLVERIPTTGVLPWGCDLDQTGRFFFVTNLTSNSVSLFKVDPVSGKLSQAGPDVSSPMPVTAITVPV